MATIPTAIAEQQQQKPKDTYVFIMDPNCYKHFLDQELDYDLSHAYPGEYAPYVQNRSYHILCFEHGDLLTLDQFTVPVLRESLPDAHFIFVYSHKQGLEYESWLFTTNGRGAYYPGGTTIGYSVIPKRYAVIGPMENISSLLMNIWHEDTHLTTCKYHYHPNDDVKDWYMPMEFKSLAWCH